MREFDAFIGLDVHKESIAVAVADAGRDGEIRYQGDITNTPAAMNQLIKKLGKKYSRLQFCYEAGPCGYAVHRQIIGKGHSCVVVAPSLIPTKPGDHIKTDRRDATMLARLLRANELTAVWVPDQAHEAMRDLIRGRISAMQSVRSARQQLKGFLLRQDIRYPGKGSWTQLHMKWLKGLTFAQPAHYILVQELLCCIEEADMRRARLEKQIETLIPSWSMAPVVEAIQAMRGIRVIAAVTIVAEVGDFTRFTNPRQLMAYLGLVPSEYSSGNRVTRGGITKTGSARARRVIMEGAWTYSKPVGVGREQIIRQKDLPMEIRRIALDAQTRLCARFRKMKMRGKQHNVVATAIAREMVGFIWAIANKASPLPQAA